MLTLPITVHNGQPRVLDLQVAATLAYAQPRDIRKLINRRIDELARYGEVCATVAQTLPLGGRPSTEYHLNEGQALLICALSDTDKAADARETLIKTFLQWRSQQRGGAGTANSGLLDGAGNPVAMQPLDIAGMDATARMRCVDLASRLHGPEYARQLYRDIGLPRVSVTVPGGRAEAIACLDRIMSGEAFGHCILDLLNGALDDPAKAVEPLRLTGILIDDDGDSFTIANRAPALEACFKGTKWQSAGWGPTLRRLPGAIGSKARRFGHGIARGTTLPATVLDLLDEI